VVRSAPRAVVIADKIKFFNSLFTGPNPAQAYEIRPNTRVGNDLVLWGPYWSLDREHTGNTHTHWQGQVLIIGLMWSGAPPTPSRSLLEGGVRQLSSPIPLLCCRLSGAT
jgi:hypothetical protein